MFMVRNLQLCRAIHVKKYGNSSSRKLCMFILRGATLSTKCQWSDDRCKMMLRWKFKVNFH